MGSNESGLCGTYLIYAVTWWGLTIGFTKGALFGISTSLHHFASLTVWHAISVLVLYGMFLRTGSKRIHQSAVP